MSHHHPIDPWRVLHSEHLFRDPWLTVRKDRVQLPSGATIDDYFVLEYPDWVNVLAITADNRIVTVRQYRHGSRTIDYELPAGVVEPAPRDASPLAAAQRELLEETGYGGGDWSHLMTLSANTSTHTNRSHTYLARNVSHLRPPHRERTEDLAVHLLTHAELEDLVLSGRILQALNAAPILRYLLCPPAHPIG